jgi:hypothetical protein
VWDAGLIAASRLGETGWVRQVASRLAGADLRRLAAGTIVDWALETHLAAVEHAYVIPPSRRLGRGWVAQNEPVVERQLALAAIRLARVLNDALAP